MAVLLRKESTCPDKRPILSHCYKSIVHTPTENGSSIMLNPAAGLRGPLLLDGLICWDRNLWFLTEKLGWRVVLTAGGRSRTSRLFQTSSVFELEL